MQLNNNLKPIDFEVPDVAIGLGGGALRGAYEAGVLVALGQIGLVDKANLIMGTSVGSANAATVALNWLKLIPLWENIKTSKDVWKGDINNNFTNVWQALFAESILDPAPFYKIVKDLMGDMTMEELAKIKDIELIFPAINNNTHQLEFFTSFGDLKNTKAVDAIIASGAVPIGLKSKEITMPGGVKQWFTDGGTAANNPFVGVHKYNQAFPNDRVKKLILIFCDGDAPAVDKKDYRLARDAGLNQIQTTLDTGEQVAELYAEMITSYGIMDVCAIYHKGGVGSSFVADPERLKVGYADGVSMQVWDYRDRCTVNLIDFLKRK